MAEPTPNDQPRPPEINGDAEWRKFETVNVKPCVIEGLPGQTGFMKVQDGKLVHAVRGLLTAPGPWLLLIVPILGGILWACIITGSKLWQVPAQLTTEIARATTIDERHTEALDAVAESLKMHEVRQGYEMEAIHNDLRAIGRAVGAHGISQDTTDAKPHSYLFEPNTR